MPGFVHRVAARDRALFERLALRDEAATLTRASWALLTLCGSAVVTVLLSIIPLVIADGPLYLGALRSTAVLILSHIVVQIVKRTVARPRPIVARARIFRVPDRFSFPSGHAAAALSVAIGYASANPDLAVPLLAVAGVAGASRVVLGVHFPADVVAGQLITLLTALAVAPFL